MLPVIGFIIGFVAMQFVMIFTESWLWRTMWLFILPAIFLTVLLGYDLVVGL